MTDISYPIANNNKIYNQSQKGYYKFRFEITANSLISSNCFVGDEFWIFTTSEDDNSDYKDVQRYSINFDTKIATKLGWFTHNWGHINSISYNQITDALILGNGGASYELSSKIIIFEDASDFSSLTDDTAVGIINAIIIDISSFGSKANVVWGDYNSEKGNICYVITNDNKNIRKLLLGQGTNNLGSGTLLSNKTGLEYNGTYKILKEYEQTDGDDVNQGTSFIGGALYIAIGHSDLWYTVNYLTDDGIIVKKYVKEIMYDDNGDVEIFIPEGITVTEDNIIIGGQFDSKKYIYIYTNI